MRVRGAPTEATTTVVLGETWLALSSTYGDDFTDGTPECTPEPCRKCLAVGSPVFAPSETRDEAFGRAGSRIKTEMIPYA